MTYRLVTSAAAGLCLGFAFAQVVFHYFFIGVVFRVLHVNLTTSVKVFLGPDYLMNVILMGYVLYQVGRDEKQIKLFGMIGMGLWVLALVSGK